ncbi:adenosylmethionine--8-amino-7-oxononanoate transaminase [Corynebacterium epidermidicanis]|uniref:Adenosylmethionine-8-amino-7-oxononanoate aminotransferase n=1 Tax=Corynebacterium epidermidicanis TaxID=1050174 RepID=A0A0G3GPB0_9CORY|nr:adenosylmethionine--8-amino-7-oxononanoate transaminase [Corynebacterium epidermidicanis]AKK03061.1 adenosylmethionine-8-amino-7-oxononanoate transaminase [Corynebacterium epidermidicanis]
MDSAQLIDIDRQLIWHPYSPCPNPMLALPVASARGTRLTLADGRELIDAMSSWWAAAHGHSHPALIAAATKQINTMSHVMFGGLTHEPAVELAQRLTALTGLDKVFYSDSGSVAVEVAIKMALQYQRGAGQAGRTKLLTWRGGYHGDTFAPMSVCDPEGGMHALWRGSIAEQIFAPRPPDRGAGQEHIDQYLAEFARHIDDTVAAIIIEPIVQGAGGMRFHDAELLVGLRQLCDEHGVLLIADEIATGFGRTGQLFATTGAGIKPDIMCLGKALTGGFMTFAATLASDRVAEAINRREAGGALMHGPTFMANPLACAVAVAAVKLVESGQWRVQVPRIEAGLKRGLAPLRDEGAARAWGVRDVRVLGAIGVVELEESVDMAATTNAAVEAGVWIRPFGTLIYVMPPFISTDEEITKICTAVQCAVQANAEQKGH